MRSLRSFCLGLILTSHLQLSNASPIAGACAAGKTTPTRPNDAALPLTNLSFQYVLVGRGIQNYTCDGPSAQPKSIGAVATLYDATELARLSTTLVDTIPPLALDFPVSPDSLTLASMSLPVIGHHYFDAAGTPVFALTGVNKILYATKAAEAAAPAGAKPGKNGFGPGAVNWLYLTAKPDAPSVGLGAAYRVVSAGGKADCTQAGAQQIDYAAEYWFYG